MVNGKLVSGSGPNKKRPKPIGSGRLAALPQNCQTTIRMVDEGPPGVNVTLVIRIHRVVTVRSHSKDWKTERGGSHGLLLLPGLAAVAGHPDQLVRSSQTAMLGIGKINPNDVGS
jgi:hypothetical protein